MGNKISKQILRSTGLHVLLFLEHRKHTSLRFSSHFLSLSVSIFHPARCSCSRALPNHAYQRRTPEFTDVQSLTNRELTGVHGVALLCSASIFPLCGRFFLHFFHSALASPPSGASCPDQPKKEGDPHPREPPFPFRHSAFSVHLSQIASALVFHPLSAQR